MLHDAICRQTPVVWARHAAGRRPSGRRVPSMSRRLPPIQTHRAIPGLRAARAIVAAPDAAAGQSDDDAHKAGAGGTYSAAVPDAKAEELSPRSPEADASPKPSRFAPRGIISAAKAQTLPDVELRRIAPGHLQSADQLRAAGGTYSRTRLRPVWRRATTSLTPNLAPPAAAETPGPTGQEAGHRRNARHHGTAGFHPFRDAAAMRQAGGHWRSAHQTVPAACHPNTGGTHA